jgi:hypothetical protein
MALRVYRWVAILQSVLIACGGYVSLAYSDDAVNAKNPRQRPRSYQECVDAGGTVRGEEAGRCVVDGGLVFERPSPRNTRICEDRCGDGTCQEIVCMAQGCPCPESPQSCPKDCIP